MCSDRCVGSIEECHLEYTLFVLEVYLHQEIVLILELFHHSRVHVDEKPENEIELSSLEEEKMHVETPS